VIFVSDAFASASTIKSNANAGENPARVMPFRNEIFVSLSEPSMAGKRRFCRMLATSRPGGGYEYRCFDFVHFQPDFVHSPGNFLVH
jgi:hypothetical protein